MTLPSPLFQQNASLNCRTLKKPPQSKFSQNARKNPQPQTKTSFPNFCKYCQIGFLNDTELFQHRRSHTKCPYDECHFNANEITVSSHIQRVHLKQKSLVKIEDLTTPEQIEKWREERRKRYPTTQNVILRQQIQEEKINRGEKLNDSKKRFGDHRQRDFVKNMGMKNNRNNGHNKNNHNRSKNFQQRQLNFQQRQSNFQQRQSNPHNKVDNKQVNDDKIEELNVKTENKEVRDEALKFPSNHIKQPKVIEKQESDSSDEEVTRALPRFRGTFSMKNYHTVETNVKEKPALSLLGMYGSDSEDESGTEIEENCGESVAEIKPNEKEVSEDLEILTDKIEVDNLGEEIDESTSQEIDEESQTQNEIYEPSDNDDGPEEIPIIKQPENSREVEDKAQTSRKRKRKNTKQPVPKKVVRQSGLDYSKLKNGSVNPFLENLLERDIVHERNVMLQCVNFVVKNNFFGIGAENGNEK